MNLNRWLSVVFVTLALAGCTQTTVWPGQVPYAPYSQNSGAEMRSGGDGGGGGGM